jgi:hypothetical protein
MLEILVIGMSSVRADHHRQEAVAGRWIHPRGIGPVCGEADLLMGYLCLGRRIHTRRRKGGFHDSSDSCNWRRWRSGLGDRREPSVPITGGGVADLEAVVEARHDQVATMPSPIPIQKFHSLVVAQRTWRRWSRLHASKSQSRRHRSWSKNYACARWTQWEPDPKNLRLVAPPAIWFGRACNGFHRPNQGSRAAPCAHNQCPMNICGF